MPITETTLVECARRGDQEAVVEIYERYKSSIFMYIFFRVNDQDCAEDLTAEVFVRMIGKLKAYVQRDRPFLAWLYTIAHNLVMDHYRGGNGIPHLPLEEDLVAGDVGHPVKAAEDRLALECLARALKFLTDEQREVIFLKFMEDREIDEVAALLGKNERAVRSLQHRALSALHRAMTQERCYEP